MNETISSRRAESRKAADDAPHSVESLSDANKRKVNSDLERTNGQPSSEQDRSGIAVGTNLVIKLALHMIVLC